MKKSLSLVAVAAGVLLFLFLLSESGKKPPLIPADSLHARALTDGACLMCHAPGMRAPLKETHPPKEQCLVCHKPRGR